MICRRSYMFVVKYSVFRLSISKISFIGIALYILSKQMPVFGHKYLFFSRSTQQRTRIHIVEGNTIPRNGECNRPCSTEKSEATAHESNSDYVKNVVRRMKAALAKNQGV